jgi:hypothetical protein
VVLNLVSTGGATPAPMTPEQVQDYLGDLLDRDDFEVGTLRHPDHGLDDHEAVGVSWVRESRFPGPNWIEELREHLRTTYG